jgi:hypothetical protein
MTEPATISAAVYFTTTKIWSIFSGIAGSIVPILALADKGRITFLHALSMAVTGASLSIFVGPYLAQRFNITGIEGVVALSWFLGTFGVAILKSVFEFLEKRGVSTLDRIVDKTLGPASSASETSNNSDKK